MRNSIVVVAVSLSVLASVAQAATTPDLTRQIDDHAASAQQKADAAAVEFDSGDRASGCKALKGAAHDLDKSIDLSVQVADRLSNNEGLDEDTRSQQQASVRFSLQSIVSLRTQIQRSLVDKCQDA